VVDDDVEVLNIMQRSLERAGFQVLAAPTAQEARAILAKEKPHLILVDLALPDDSGIQLIREICSADEAPPVIIVTGNPSVSTAAEGMQLGARNYLTKPVSPNELVEAVKSVLTRDGIMIDTEEQLLAELGRRLRAARQSADLTMKALGERVGISQAQISQIESGLSAPSLSTLFRMTKALHISMSEVFADH
jgi:DNA-binding response OmpR family regulator